MIRRLLVPRLTGAFKQPEMTHKHLTSRFMAVNSDPNFCLQQAFQIDKSAPFNCHEAIQTRQ